MIRYLESLELKVKDGRVYAPYFRIDIGCKADIAEEVARLYGYNKIPSTIIRGVAQAQLTPKQVFERKLRRNMLALGASECETFSFISPKYFDKINLPEDSALRKTVVISNPLGEDTSVMRTSIIPSMCEVLVRNINYRNKAATLFELGNEYIPVEGEVLPKEPVRLCVGMYDSEDSFKFYELKGMLTELLDKAGLEDYEMSRPDENTVFAEAVSFHPGRVAVIKTKDGTEIGIFGELHPEVSENYKVKERLYIAKLLVPELMAACVPVKTYKPLPKFPASVRDLSVVCDLSTPVADIEKAVKKAVGSILESVTLFDVYTGSQIESGKKSVSYSITMRSHDGTLTDEQTDKAMDKVFKALADMGAALRE